MLLTWSESRETVCGSCAGAVRNRRALGEIGDAFIEAHPSPHNGRRRALTGVDVLGGDSCGAGGAFARAGLISGSARPPDDAGHFNLSAVLLTEVALTMLLVLVVLATTERIAHPALAGIPIGFTLVVIHLIETLLWTFPLLQFDIIPNFRNAYYYVLEAYTTLGEGNIALPDEWRLVGPVIAISGLFTFGWTASVLVYVMNEVAKLHAERSRAAAKGAADANGETKAPAPKS